MQFLRILHVSNEDSAGSIDCLGSGGSLRYSGSIGSIDCLCSGGSLC